MTLQEYKKIKSVIRKALDELQQEAISQGFDLMSAEYEQAQERVKIDVLTKFGFTLEEYDAISGYGRNMDKKSVAYAFEQIKKQFQDKESEIKKSFSDINDKIVRTDKKITKWSDIAGKPEIITTGQIERKIAVAIKDLAKRTEIKPEVIKTKEIIREIDNTKLNDINQDILALQKVVSEIKVPEIDDEAVMERLKGFAVGKLNEAINIFGMPDFRKLAMGLRADIDALVSSGSLPSQAGNSGKFLTTNGTVASWAAVSGGGTPASPDTSIQYNNGGSFGGARLLYTNPSTTSALLTVADQSLSNTNGYDFTILGGRGTGSDGEPGAINIIGAPWASLNNNYRFGDINIAGGSDNTQGQGFGGGYVNITAGNGDTGGSGPGGKINITAGHGDVTDGGSGGDLNLRSGNGFGAARIGGAINIIAGTSDVSNGGAVLLRSGDSQGDNGGGGGFSLTAGNAFGSGEGGSFLLNSGNGGDTGNGGVTGFAAGDGGLTSGNGGDVYFSAGRAQGSGSNGRFIFQPLHGTTFQGILDFDSMATSDKTFHFPNYTGNLVTDIASADGTGQTAAKSATTLFTPTATGFYRISVYLQVTTPGSVSSVLGGATGVVLTYNDGDGNVAQSDTMALQSPAGTIVNFLNTNTTATNLSGDMVIYARTGVAIQFAIGYTSAGTAMQYAYHLRAEAL